MEEQGRQLWCTPTLTARCQTRLQEDGARGGPAAGNRDQALADIENILATSSRVSSESFEYWCSGLRLTVSSSPANAVLA